MTSLGTCHVIWRFENGRWPQFFSKAGPYSAIAADKDTAWHWDLNSVNLLLTINELSLLMIKTMFSGFVVVFLFLQCEDPEFDSLRDIIGNQGFLTASNLQLNLRSCLFNVVDQVNKQFLQITKWLSDNLISFGEINENYQISMRMTIEQSMHC